MKQRLFIILGLASTSLTTAWADNIQGKITSSAGNAVSFANVVAILKADSSFVDGVVADENGHYNLEANPRLMLLRVSSIGYDTKTVAISSPVTNITLNEATNNLDEVTVRAKKPDYKITEEGMMTTITGTALARLGTGSEVLSHIPGVYKSGGGYGVFGRGGALVYLNGRKVFNMADVDNLRSEDIKSVEVITAPGSKYSASVYAVIKIVTHKPAGEGLGMNLRSSIYQGDNTDYYTSAGWNYRSGKLDVFGFHSFSRNKTWSKSNLTQRVEADTLWNIALDQDTYVRSMSVSNQLGMNYQIDNNNFLGFRYILGTNPSSKSSNTIVSSVTANDNDFDHLTTQSHNATTYQPSGLLNAYYEGKIGQAGISWDFDFMHNGSDSRSQQEEESTSQDNRLFASASSTRSLLVATKLATTLQIAKAKLSIGTELLGSKTQRHLQRRGQPHRRIEEHHHRAPSCALCRLLLSPAFRSSVGRTALRASVDAPRERNRRRRSPQLLQLLSQRILHGSIWQNTVGTVLQSQNAPPVIRPAERKHLLWQPLHLPRRQPVSETRASTQPHAHGRTRILPVQCELHRPAQRHHLLGRALPSVYIGDAHQLHQPQQPEVGIGLCIAQPADWVLVATAYGGHQQTMAGHGHTRRTATLQHAALVAAVLQHA